MSLIPYVIAPLRGMRVLVTRPEPQASRLAKSIRERGGEPIVFPGIEIKPVVDVAAVSGSFDWCVFLSVHSVHHSKARLPDLANTRIAAIGRATAAAVAEASYEVHVTPEPLATTEGLLADARFAVSPSQRVLIVRGAGGRDALDEALAVRGAQVESLIVYERVPAQHSPAAVAQLEAQWTEDSIDIVTATSGDTLAHLRDALSPTGQGLLMRTPLAVVSPRVGERARSLGLQGELIVTDRADDLSIVAALSNWAARAR